MPAKILFRDAQGRDGAVDLRGDPVWVGRAMECAIRTDDAMVSRKHSLIKFEGGRYWVEDLGSSNGTHVNDVKVQRQALNHNDVVRCGSLWLRYIEDGPLGFVAGSGPSQPTSMVGTAAGQGLGYASTVATPARPSTTGGRPLSVMVDMGDSDRYRSQIDDLRGQLDMVRAERDKESAENKRLRAENANIQQRLDDNRTQQREAEEVIEAHKRVAEELRGEMDSLKDRDNKLTTENAEAKDDLASRTRQLQRANDEITKLKAEADGAKRQLLELSKVKDDGFKKLNEQLAEVEHLREVIREQERMLEERRVGLISVEEALQDLRRDREARIKELASMKGERDELRIGFNRQQAQMQTTDEENRRLARLMQDIGDGGETMRLSRQLKDAQFEAETQSLERRRLEQALETAEARVEKLQSDITKLEETAEADEGRAKQAIAEMHNTEEARVKAESARTKAEQERAAAIKDKEDLEREVEKLRQRLGESGPVTVIAAGSGAAKADPAAAQRVGELEEKIAEAQHRAEDAQKRLNDIMERATKLEDENHELARKLRDASKKTAVAGAAAGPHELRNKALEVYHSVNDVLAELRVNISVVRDEFDAFAGKNADARARTIRDAIEAASGQTEDVKGVLRNLRELAET